MVDAGVGVESSVWNQGLQNLSGLVSSHQPSTSAPHIRPTSRQPPVGNGSTDSLLQQLAVDPILT